MMSKSWLVTLLLGVFLVSGCASLTKGKVPGKSISPNAYGFAKAKTGEERFRALYNTHVAAIAAEAKVDYSGIKNVDLVIPKDAKSIPLTSVNVFAGVSFNVKNTQKDFYLFSYAG